MAHDKATSILGYVAQITFYVPDEVARRLRREAKRAGKSLSAYLTEVVTDERTSRAFPEGFLELEGSCRGTLQRPDDPPPEELESP